MSPDEVALLQVAGQIFVVNISVLITQSILYGLYLVIFGFGIRALLRKQSRTIYIWMLLGLLLTIFLLFTTKLAIWIAYNVIMIRGALVDNPNAALLDRFAFADEETNELYISINWLSGWAAAGLLTIFADAVVVWRACVLWPGSLIARLILLVLLFASFASVIVSSTINILSPATSENVVSVASWITGSLSLSLSIATNIVATALIGYKAYRHRSETKSTIRCRYSKVGPVLQFMTESGIVFCVLQIITLVMSETSTIPLSAYDDVTQVWQPIMSFAAAVYPILVLLIVDSRRSPSQRTTSSVLVDSGSSQESEGFDVGTHISFAARPEITSTGDVVPDDNLKAELHIFNSPQANDDIEARARPIQDSDSKTGEKV